MMTAPGVTAESTDRDLLAAIAAGDQAAIGLFYDRHAAAAMGIACRIVRDRGLAEDVVQDAFVAVWSRVGTYRPDRGEPGPWLLSIVRNRAIDRLRGATQSWTELDASTVALPSADGDVWATTVRRLDRAEILVALAELPLEQRQAIEQAFFGGRTHAEIAASSGLPLGTVKGRVRLGLLRLRQRLEAREAPCGRAPRAGALAPAAAC
jgi:RNA polymerase sigma-70 factor (ECF subfamily)